MNPFDIKDLEQFILSIDVTKPLGNTFLDNRYERMIDSFGHPTEYYRVFYYLTRYLEPDFVVELGGWQGTAAAHLAAGYPQSIIISIDHHTDPGDDQNKELTLEASRNFRNLVYLQNWTWHAIEQVKNFDKTIDILFIDSWHDYEHAMADWELYRPLLTNGALVICDDILGGNGPVISGMTDFWNQFDYEKFLCDSIHAGIPMGFFRYEF